MTNKFKAFIGRFSWFNRIQQSVTVNQQQSPFMPVGLWIDRYKVGAGYYIASSKLLDKNELLKDTTALTIKMIALSGLGTGFGLSDGMTEYWRMLFVLEGKDLSLWAFVWV